MIDGTGELRGWIGQVRICPAHLGKKGEMITRELVYLCTRVTAKLEISEAGEDKVSCQFVWLKYADGTSVNECWVSAEQWLTWPIKEA